MACPAVRVGGGLSGKLWDPNFSVLDSCRRDLGFVCGSFLSLCVSAPCLRFARRAPRVASQVSASSSRSSCVYIDIDIEAPSAPPPPHPVTR
eukprot:scaffold12647_cov101-Isochrysis_galbana.AAC.5